jgi:hypothetical protein
MKFFFKTQGWKIFLFLLLIQSGCKDPFEPKIAGEETGFLVVEGYINIGNKEVTSVSLSRTRKVSESFQQVWEQNAIVSIESENGNFFFLSNDGVGMYRSDSLSLSPNEKYRISILTTDEKQYYSEFVEPVITPEIDSVVWRRINEGVGIFVSTHDPNNQIHYYQWDYDEVWEIRSDFFSFFKYENGQMQIRDFQETIDMHSCWKYDRPKDFITLSTASLSEDLVSMKQIILIPVSNEKISTKYSVLVKQHALVREEYEYMQLIRKNTDEVGSFSDPQPSELYGNISCVNDNQPVVGFVGAYSTSRKRIIIKEREVPDWNFTLYCEQFFVENNADTLSKYFADYFFIPTMSDGGGGNYYGAPYYCVDCRRRDANNIKPDFWDE